MLVKIAPDIYVNSALVISVETSNEDAMVFVRHPTILYYSCSLEAAAHLINIVNSEGGESSGLGSALVLPGEAPRVTEDGGTGFWRCNAVLRVCQACGQRAKDIKHSCVVFKFVSIVCTSAVPDNQTVCDFCGAPKPERAFSDNELNDAKESEMVAAFLADADRDINW